MVEDVVLALKGGHVVVAVHDVVGVRRDAPIVQGVEVRRLILDRNLRVVHVTMDAHVGMQVLDLDHVVVGTLEDNLTGFLLVGGWLRSIYELGLGLDRCRHHELVYMLLVDD